MRLTVEFEGVEVEDSADIFEVEAVFPRVTSGRGFNGLRDDIAIEKLVFADEIPKKLSTCRLQILMSLLHFF